MTCKIVCQGSVLGNREQPAVIKLKFISLIYQFTKGSEYGIMINL